MLQIILIEWENKLQNRYLTIDLVAAKLPQ